MLDRCGVTEVTQQREPDRACRLAQIVNLGGILCVWRPTKRVSSSSGRSFDCSTTQKGLDASTAQHEAQKLRRSGDPHYFSRAARRVSCEALRSKGLLVTDPDHERSALPMSSIQIEHGTVLLWVLRSTGEVPVASSDRKKAFYRQVPNLEDRDNLLLLWDDVDGVLRDPMMLIRPLSGGRFRRDLVLDWEGPLSRRMADMRVQDLDELKPRYEQTSMEGNVSA